jgi:hypothetical protein
VNENDSVKLPPGLPPTIGWLVEFDELENEKWVPQRHLVLEEPEGHYADCATPLVSALAVHDLGYAGWIPLSEQLPRIMSGHIALLHPDKDEPTVSYVGTHPIDFREDGYSHYMPLARTPPEHLRHRRRMKSGKK